MNCSQTRRPGENLSQVFWFRVAPIQRDVFQFLTQNVVWVHLQHREHKLEESWQLASGVGFELQQVVQQRHPDTSGNEFFCQRVDHRFGIGRYTLRR